MSKILTKKQKGKFLNSTKKIYCPYCGTESQNSLDTSSDIDIIYRGLIQIVTCNDCGNSWAEKYELVDIF